MLTLIPSAIRVGSALDALGRARDLDHDVRPIEEAEHAPCLRHHRRRRAFLSLEGDEAVAPRGAFVDLAQRVGRRSQVLGSKHQEGLVRIGDALAAKGVERRVVVVGAGDRLEEDRRVRGHAPDPARLHHPGELAGLEQAPADVVEPGALAERVQALQVVSGVLRSHADHLQCGSHSRLPRPGRRRSRP